MNNPLMTCPMCGLEFDPTKNASCSTCPLHRGCSMVCCPNCGYTAINPQESRLVQWVQKLRGEKSNAQYVE